MKFRYKEIINWIIIIFPVFFSLIVFYAGILYAFIGVLVVRIIVGIFRYKNYTELDDIGVKQVKYNLLFKKKIKIIPYEDIIEIKFGRNHTLSKVDVGNHEHYIYSISGEIMKIGMIFHFKKFKNILKEKIGLNGAKSLLTKDDYPKNINRNSPNYFSLRDYNFNRIEIVLVIFFCGYIFINLYMKNFDFKSFKFRPDILFFTPIIILLIFIGVKFCNFVKKRPFVMLEDNQLIIVQNSEATYAIQKIHYSNIEKIEVNIPGSSIISLILGSTFYIKLKNRKNEKSVHGLRNGDAFIKALKGRGVNAYFSPSNEIISDLKE